MQKYNMFKYTQSITNQQPKQQIQHIPKMNIDLFDLLNNYDQQDEEDIQTFGQLKQWINTYKFSANQQKSQVEPRMMEPKIKIDRGKFSLDRRIQSMELSQNYLNDSSLGPKLSGNHFLQVIQQDAKSRASKKPKRRSSQNYTIQFGSPQIPQNKQKQSHGQFINGNNNEGSIKKSSAHSSRSFNGYDLINQYQVKDKLGQGAFSNVYQCIDIHSDKKYAMKTLQKKSFRKKLFRKNSLNLAQNYIQNEIAILKKMQHPYIIKLHEVIADEQKQKSYLILDYCAKGFICQNRNNQNNHQQQSQKRRYKRLLESQCKRYFKQFCLGLNYIHNVAKIAHRDIKPQNILLSQKDQVKISDFGLGTEDIEIRSKSGTRNFLPPQIINKTQQTSQKINIQKGDVWASGITLLIMLTGRNIDQQVTQLPKIIQKLKDVSQQCKKFIEVCLEINPEKRITSKQMLQHPWINIKQTRQYEEIVVSKEDQEKAIISRLNKEILSAVTKLKL